jgi:transposase InsO family protein
MRRRATRDRDCIYGTIVTRRLHAMGIRDRPIAPASPWQNGFAERLIGSTRRECLNHIVISGEARRTRRRCDFLADIVEHDTILARTRAQRAMSKYCTKLSDRGTNSEFLNF